MSKKAFFFAALALLFAFGFSVEANAQRAQRAIFRWLGDGLSDGYHRQRKGPDIGYYNPYSAHNSHRIVAGQIGCQEMSFGQGVVQQQNYSSIFEPAMINQAATINAPPNPNVSQQRPVVYSQTRIRPPGRSSPSSTCPVNSTIRGEVQSFTPITESLAPGETAEPAPATLHNDDVPVDFRTGVLESVGTTNRNSSR